MQSYVNFFLELSDFNMGNVVFLLWKKCIPIILCVLYNVICCVFCQGSTVLQTASGESGWEKDAVFLHLSPSWQQAVVG